MFRSPSVRAALFLVVAAFVTLCAVGTAAAAPVAYSRVGTVGPGATAAPYNVPSGVDVDWAGRVWVSEYTAARLQWFGAGGSGFVGWYRGWTSPSVHSYGWIGGVWSDERTGNLYVGDTTLRKIHRLAGGSDAFLNDLGSDVLNANDRFTGLRGVAIDAWGTVYGSDPSSNTVRTFSPDGTFRGTLGSSETAGGSLHFPYGVDWDYDGRVYVAGAYSPRGVFVYGPDRSFETSWLAACDGVCVDPGGNLFVTQGQSVSRMTTAGVQLDQFGGTGSPWYFQNLSSVRDDGARNLYVTDASANTVTKVWAPVPTTYSTPAAGANRYDTAIRISRTAYPRGMERNDPEGWRSVVVATGENWPDALGASALAGAVDGPILLVPGKLPLPTGLTAEPDRLGAGRAFIVGGTGAVSSQVASAIADALGGGAGRIERFAGANRYETSWMVAQKVRGWNGGTECAFVATGRDFPDALSASPVAAAAQWPIYLADPDGSFVQSMTASGVTRAIILGGTGVVPESTEASLQSVLTTAAVSRWAGANRYATSAVVASQAVEIGAMRYQLRANRVAMATGASFPDGLAGGPLQAKQWGPLLLTRPTQLPAEVSAWLTARKDSVYHVTFLGGDGAVSSTVRNAVKPFLW